MRSCDFDRVTDCKSLLLSNFPEIEIISPKLKLICRIEKNENGDEAQANAVTGDNNKADALSDPKAMTSSRATDASISFPAKLLAS